MTLPFERNIKCSNYVGETIDMAVDMGVKGILFVAHIGKFVKVAAGIMNTHPTVQMPVWKCLQPMPSEWERMEIQQELS